MIGKYINANHKTFFILFMAFIAGVAAGGFTVNGLSTIQSDELTNYFQGFLQLMQNQNVDGGELLTISLTENLKIIGTLWVLGMTIIGIPFIIAVMGIKGFITGFSCGLIIKVIGVKGILFTLFGILPKELILVPCIIALGVNGIDFSLKIIRNRPVKKAFKRGLKTDFLQYCLITLFLCGIALVGILVESYVTPVFIRILSPMIIN
jgi:stage II sporulation protein M